MTTKELRIDGAPRVEPRGDFFSAQEILRTHREDKHRAVSPEVTVSIISERGDGLVMVYIATEVGAMSMSRRVDPDRMYSTAITLIKAALYAKHPEVSEYEVGDGVVAHSQDGQVTASVDIKTPFGIISSKVATPAKEDYQGLNTLGNALSEGFEAALVLNK